MLPLNKVLEWEQNYYPAIVVGVLTFVFLWVAPRNLLTRWYRTHLQHSGWLWISNSCLVFSQSAITSCTAAFTMLHNYTVERGLVVSFCVQPHYCNRSYYPTAQFQSPLLYTVSVEPFLYSSRSTSCELAQMGSHPITFLWLWPATMNHIGPSIGYNQCSKLPLQYCLS